MTCVIAAQPVRKRKERFALGADGSLFHFMTNLQFLCSVSQLVEWCCVIQRRSQEDISEGSSDFGLNKFGRIYVNSCLL